MLVHCSVCGHPNHNVHCCDGMVARCEQGPAQPCEKCGWDVMQPAPRKKDYRGQAGSSSSPLI